MPTVRTSSPKATGSQAGSAAINRLLHLLLRPSVRHASAALLLSVGCASNDDGPGNQGRHVATLDEADSDAAVPDGEVVGDAAQVEDPFAAFPTLPDGTCDYGLDELASSLGVTYLAVAQGERVSVDETGPHDSLSITAESGTACADASDIAACETTRSDLEDAFFAPLPPCNPWTCRPTVLLLSTEGDEVGLYQSGQVAQMLGVIDSPSKARLVFAAAGLGQLGTCGDANEFGYQETPDGFLLRSHVLSRDCEPVEYSHDTYLVRHDGTFEKVSRVIESSEPGECITF